MRALAQKFGLNINLVVAKDHEESFEQLATGKVDAFAGDDVLLYGSRPTQGCEQPGCDRRLSVRPSFGIMFRRDDPELAELVNRVFRDLAESLEPEYTYNRWFLAKLPSGETLNLPMSAQLDEIFKALGAPD